MLHLIVLGCCVSIFIFLQVFSIYSLISPVTYGRCTCPSKHLGKDNLAQASWSHLISAQIVSFYFRTLFLKAALHETYNLLQRHPPVHLYHSHGDPTSLAPHERLTDLAVVPREKAHTGAAAREQPRASPVIAT